jgi:hypothetical protein
MRSELLRFRKAVFIFSGAVMLTALGCGPDKEGDDPNGTDIDTPSVNTGPINVEGEIFSIPSPIQMAMLIKQVGANYNKEILNSPKNVTNYTSNFQKALNMGIYGADLGYVTLYDQTQDALGYLQGVKRLGDDLGITGAFDMNLLSRFEQNIGKKDSMLAMVSDAYRASDAYLKNNERNDISGLVLTGGWIESLHFAINVNTMKSTPEIMRRIGEQKSSLESLIRLLKQHESQPEYAELVSSLEDLMTAYDGIEFVYVFKEPTTDPAKKMTTINSSTDVKITQEQVNKIAEKIESIRKQIVG